MSSMAAFSEEPILLVDDDPSWLHSLAFTLEYTGHYRNLLTCSDSRELIGRLRDQPVALILLDLVMPHIGGEDLLVQIGQEFPQVPVIVLSGLNQLETAVGCMKLGAFDYYVKTTEPDRLLAGIDKALAMRALQRENRELTTRLLRRELKHPELFQAFATRSPKLEAIFHYLEAIAASREPLLICGEPGTGKRLAARALHALACPDGELVCVPAADLTAGRLAAQLYGTANQTGLLEVARHGMLYLEGVEQLPAAAQARLMELLQQGEYLAGGNPVPRRLEARLVCSTGVDLAGLAGEGRFRKDLFYRLSMHQIRLPALRERQEDLSLLIEELVAAACTTLGCRKPQLPRNLVPLLASYPFPGNLPELQQLVETALRQSPSGRLSLGPFQHYLGCPRGVPGTGSAVEAPLLLTPGRLPTLAEARELVIREALQRSNGNQSIAARLLGISQPALSIHLKKAGFIPRSS